MRSVGLVWCAPAVGRREGGNARVGAHRTADTTTTKNARNAMVRRPMPLSDDIDTAPGRPRVIGVGSTGDEPS